MVDKDIIKALECCGKNHITGSTDACEHCFLQNSAMCVTELIYKTLDLINRQQAELSDARIGVKSYKGKYESAVTAAKELLIVVAEKESVIERLKKANEGYAELERGRYVTGYKKIRDEAIRYFTDRLKEKKQSICVGHGVTECVVSVYDINNLVKEMVGEK
jgi:hypothetical protein